MIDISSYLIIIIQKGYNYLFSLLREVKGGKISDIQNNTNKSKQVLITYITVPSLQGIVICNMHEFG